MSTPVPVSVDLYDAAGRLLGTASVPADPALRGVIVWGSRYFVQGMLSGVYREREGVVIANLDTVREP